MNIQNNFSLKFSPKGKMPWIELNDVKLGDTQFIIEYLSKLNNINLNAHLTPVEMATSRTVMKLCEESLYWCILLHRYVYAPSPEVSGIPKWLLLYSKFKTKKSTEIQGYGLHSKEEVYHIGRSDLRVTYIIFIF